MTGRFEIHKAHSTYQFHLMSGNSNLMATGPVVATIEQAEASVVECRFALGLTEAGVRPSWGWDDLPDVVEVSG